MLTTWALILSLPVGVGARGSRGRSDRPTPTLPPDDRPRPHGTEPDRLPPHRRGAHVPLQLALRARPGRRVPAADREHRHEPRGGRGGGADRGVAALARDRVGRRDPLPARRRRALPHRGGAARRRGQGVRGRRRDPDPDAEGGRDRLGRRDQGPDRVPGGRARGHGHPPLRRPARSTTTPRRSTTGSTGSRT